MEENALSLEDIWDAAIVWRMARTVDGFVIEIGEATDHLFDLPEALWRVRQALEKGDEAEIVVSP